MKKYYKDFFIDSIAGQEFLQSINNMIQSNHEKAETTPENARDFTQRAKGNREVLDMISTLCSGSKKGGSRTKS